MHIQNAILLLGVIAPGTAQAQSWWNFFSQLGLSPATASPAPNQQGNSAAVAAPPAPAAQSGGGKGNGLDGLFKAKGKKYYGTATDAGLLGGQSAGIIQQQFGQITHENSMKWDTVESSRGKFNFGQADQVVDWAAKNGKIVRGHTLVWHSQLPGWVSSVRDKAELTKVIENHVDTVVSHYKGKIYAWDVVNEILDESGGLRKSVFSDVLGDSFVGIAFRAARKADPAAKLYINDYNLDAPNSIKTRTMIQKVTQWRAAGIPIDGIGTQSHLEQGMSANTGALLKSLCAAADECAITELDIKGASAQDYGAVAKACLAEPKCVGITVWGVSDKDSWRKQNSPLLYDSNFKPKPAVQATEQSAA